MMLDLSSDSIVRVDLWQDKSQCHESAIGKKMLKTSTVMKRDPRRL